MRESSFAASIVDRVNHSFTGIAERKLVTDGEGDSNICQVISCYISTTRLKVAEYQIQYIDPYIPDVLPRIKAPTSHRFNPAEKPTFKTRSLPAHSAFASLLSAVSGSPHLSSPASARTRPIRKSPPRRGRRGRVGVVPFPRSRRP